MRRVSGAVVGLVLIGLLSGCGGWTLRSAGRMTDDAVPPAPSDGVGYTPYTETTIVPAVQGALAEHRTYHAEVHASFGLISMDVRLGAAGEYDIALTMTGPEAMEMIVVDDRVFLRLSGDEKYTQLTDEAVEEVLGEIGDMTPTRLAADLDEAMEAMHYAGSRTTHGRKLYGYVIEMDPAYLARQTGGSLPEGAAAEMDYRIWLDEDGLWWRSEVALLGEHVDVTLSRWDRPVHIEAPSPAEIDYFSA